VLDLLTRLVDRSLVVVEVAAAGAARYRLLETLRQYGRQRLAAMGEAEALRARHAQYYAAFAVTAEQWLAGHEQLAWLDRVDLEADNLRGALRWLDGGGQEDAALHLAAALLVWWFTR
jgi:predicted ATPase